jgi:uncharacterized protein YbjT (DUF2867 family)
MTRLLRNLSLLSLAAASSCIGARGFSTEPRSTTSTEGRRGPRDGGVILVVGASGGTGPRALSGLVDAGYPPSRLRVMTRDVDKPSVRALRSAGFETHRADMDDPPTLAGAVSGCSGCYVHSTSSDTRALDAGEVDRARNLARVIADANVDAGPGGGVRRVVYNSAAAEDGHGVRRIAQKRAVERVFREEMPGAPPFVSLRANLFMEELWKGYTRPAVLRGRYPFSVPADRPVYLTSVRDMGRLAGTILGGTADDASDYDRDWAINVASDVLTPRGMADAFARAQGSACVHDRSRLFGLLARLFFRDLHEVIRFYRTSTETTDVEALGGRYPGLLTSFEAFLEETRWGDADLTYKDLAATGD